MVMMTRILCRGCTASYSCKQGLSMGSAAVGDGDALFMQGLHSFFTNAPAQRGRGWGQPMRSAAARCAGGGKQGGGEGQAGRQTERQR